MPVKPLSYLINQQTNPPAVLSIRAFAQSLATEYRIKTYLSWTGCKLVDAEGKTIYIDGEYTPSRAIGDQQMNVYRLRMIAMVMFCAAKYPTEYILKCHKSLSSNKETIQ